MAAPRPAGEVDTQADAHLAELDDLLSAADPALRIGDRIRVVRTLADLREAVAEADYPLFYYYGHGDGDRRRSRLIFEDRYGNADAVGMADLGKVLALGHRGPPLLAYLNCCSGDTGGVIGAGRQLGGLVPAVITNRTAVYIVAAREQAKVLWRSILIDGTAPHRAVAELYGRLPELGFSFKDVRWLNPVLHARYGGWRANPPRPTGDLDKRDPHWRVKLDRRNQVRHATYEVREMLRRAAPRCQIYIWYGREGQGVDLFQQRLAVELDQDIGAQAQMIALQPRWPDYLRTGFCADMYCQALDVQGIDDIPAAVRRRARVLGGRQPLLYIRHEPVQPQGHPDFAALMRYIDWCDNELSPLLEAAGAFAVIGVPRMLGSPKPFDLLFKGHAWPGRRFNRQLQGAVDARRLNLVQVHPLEGMESLDKKDLEHFLDNLDVRFPLATKDKMLNDIMKRTKGNYEETLNALQEAVETRWRG